ncbi:MAG: DNA polymerase III subunit beta [Tenericutes bacterium]|nr:MAG: DNA polymerase III subunit beta [Mycoplasmatota bacterium]
MQIEIKTKLLNNYLSKISSLTPASISTPIAEGLAIDVFDSRIVFETKNDFINVRIETSDFDSINIIKTGSILIKRKLISEIISKMGGESIRINQLENSILSLNGIDSDYELNLLDSSLFDRVEFNESVGIEFELNSTKLIDQFNKVAYAGNERNARKILQGINISNNNGKMTLTTTDGVRIATTTFVSNIDAEFSRVVNIKAMKELIKLLEPNQTLKMNLTDTHMNVKTNNLEVQTNLIEGNFPIVDRFFEVEELNVLKISKSELLSLIDRVNIMNSNKASDSITIKLIIVGDELKIETREIEIGYAHVTTKKFDYNGKDHFMISFNPKFVAESIKSFNSEEIMINFQNHDDPFIITEVNNKDTKSLLTPFRI